MKTPKKKNARTSKALPKVITPEVLSEETLESENEIDDSDAEVIEAEIIGDPSLPAAVNNEELLEENLPALPPHLDPFKHYLKDISRYPLLNPEEEFALAVKLRDTGDIDAAKRLVQANLRLVVKIAMEYRSAYQNILDLVQEGNVGLMKAVSKFDPSKGARLGYYASWWIRSYILKYILDNFRQVRVGTTAAQKKLFFHLMREKERLEAQGLSAGPKLLAEKLNVREQDVVEMEKRLGVGSGDVSLNQTLGGDGESKTTHQDLLADDREHADEVIEWEELKEVLKEHLSDFVKTLKEKELAIFKERLAAEQPKTLQEVADLFGLTRERARQIEVKVIEKLRDFYKSYIR